MDRTGIKWNSGDEITALEISDPNNRESRFVVPCGFVVGYYKSRALTWNHEKSSFDGHNYTFEGHRVNEVFVDELMPRKNPIDTIDALESLVQDF